MTLTTTTIVKDTNFVARAVVRDDGIATYRRWRSRDGSCAVVEIQSHFRDYRRTKVRGTNKTVRDAEPSKVDPRYAVILTPHAGAERILSRHATKSAAFLAGERLFGK